GVYNLGMDEEVIKYISSANIACGFHAGDPAVMDKTVKMAAESGVMVGAHPSFRDLVGFGRRKMDLEPEEVKQILIYQIGALKAFAEANNLKLQHVKPHGAVYNLASTDEDIALAAAEAIKKVDDNLIFVALAGSLMHKAADEVGIKAANEVFADRAYNLDGTLVSRKREGAVIEDPIEVKNRVLRMVKKGEVETIDGKKLELKADTICVHGDNPAAVDLVKELTTAMKENNIEVTAMSNFL
ncbi:MAG: LamB/YcsF family protein, partial [Bacillota bacterium]